MDRLLWEAMVGSIWDRLGFHRGNLGPLASLFWSLTPLRGVPALASDVLLHCILLLLPCRPGEGPDSALCQVWEPLQPPAQCG